MNARETPGSVRPRLYHAPASYYSMVARLALAEAGLDHDQVFVDIHVRGSQQSPAYARLNPNLTVPTLVLPGQIMVQSRDILEAVLVGAGHTTGPEASSWIDLHYAFSIEELTFGNLLARHAAARAMIPVKLAASHRRLLRLAAAHPDLAGIYQRRAAVFAERQRTFDPKAAMCLAAQRRKQAIGLLDRLDRHLADGRDVMVPPRYGAADVVWTVFLARIEFVGMAVDIACRPALARYWRAMQARPSFTTADIWTRAHIGRLVRGIIHG